MLKNEAVRKRILMYMVFTFYLCLGFSLSRYNNPDMNIYLGADNARAFDDLIMISGVSHYRIKVHPLMLILIQPITLLIDGVIHHRETTLVILQSMVGTLCVWSIYRVLHKFCKNIYVIILLTLIYAMSFSNMIFSTVPETFIFAGFFLIMFWRFILDNIGVESLSVKKKIILMFFGIVCFGITITNYAQFLIGLLTVILFTKEENKNKIIAFLQIILANILGVLGIAKFQQLAWKGDTPFFLDSYLVLLGKNSNTFEELNYTNFEFSSEKIGIWIEQVFIRPFIAGRIEQIDMGNGYYPILFQEGYKIPDILICIIAAILVISVILSLRGSVWKKELGILVAALLFNFMLHFVYGYQESFMYSPHYLFLIIVLLGIGIDNFTNKRQKTLCFFLSFFLVCEIIVNLKIYRELISIVVNFLGNQPYSVMAVFVKICVSMIFVFMFIIIIEYQMKKVVSFELLKKVYKDDVILSGILAYSILIFVSSFFICFST